MLVLVPSRLELAALAPDLAASAREGDVARWPELGPGVRLALTGVGPVEAGAVAGFVLARHGATRAVLAGLCGTLRPEELPMARAFLATHVEEGSVGVGSGADFRPFAAAGGPLSLEPDLGAGRGPWCPALPLASRGGLLSACSASADRAEAERRRVRHATCLAEDMEAAAVLAAARLADVPLAVLRAASNVAGDREHRGWRIAEAMAAVRASLGALAALP